MRNQTDKAAELTRRLEEEIASDQEDLKRIRRIMYDSKLRFLSKQKGRNAILLIFLGFASLGSSIYFWLTPSSSPESTYLLEIITVIFGLGASIKGWIDLFMKGGKVPSTLSGKLKDRTTPEIGDTKRDWQSESREGDEEESTLEIKELFAWLGKLFFIISIAHPKLISKRFASPFLVQVYFKEFNTSVKTKINEIVGENFSDHRYETELNFGQTVRVRLYSPDIIFPDPVVKRLASPLNLMTFLGKPLDTCYPGKHKVVVSISDNKTGIEYQSETFSVIVVDFAFDHVSRPLFSRVSAVVLGIGSFAMYILTLLEQIDKTIGLTSGTAAGVLALGIYASFYNLYQRVRPNTP